MSNELKALEFFKDWTNYLLVTTVAAVGWLGVKEGIIRVSRGGGSQAFGVLPSQSFSQFLL